MLMRQFQTKSGKIEKKFEKILDENKSNTNYDCIIPVSGGKDSYYQTHQIVKEYNLKPLLVTYDGNNYLPEGIENRDKMRHVFDADHLVFGPSVKSLIELNKQCFKIMGDMNWHGHCGINTYPFQVAVNFKVPLLIWGEPFFGTLVGCMILTILLNSQIGLELNMI